MPSMTLTRSDVIVGVDTHKDAHIGVTIDGLGGRLDELLVPATVEGYEQLLAWARTQGRVVAVWFEHDHATLPRRPFMGLPFSLYP